MLLVFATKIVKIFTYLKQRHGFFLNFASLYNKGSIYEKFNLYNIYYHIINFLCIEVYADS
jgi:hypothetical protein